jgi:hypothetical protein
MKKKFHVEGKINQVSENGDIINSYTGDVFVDKSNNNSNSNKSEKEGKPKKENNWLYLMLKNKWFLIGIIIILMGWIIFLHFHIITNPNDVTLILAFVGILATFVVVSNYAQVKDIERKFEKKIEKLDTNFDEKIKETESNLLKNIDSQSIDVYESLYALIFKVSVGSKDYQTALFSSICLLNYTIQKRRILPNDVNHINNIITIIKSDNLRIELAEDKKNLCLDILRTAGRVIDVSDIIYFFENTHCH